MHIELLFFPNMNSKHSSTASQKPHSLFEHYSQPVIPFQNFLQRLAKHGGAALALLGFSLAIGTWGYNAFSHLSWIDAFLNACMILTGMGPVDHLQTTGAKIFAGVYALYSGIAFLTCIGILFVPILHRIMHKFHLKA